MPRTGSGTWHNNLGGSDPDPQVVPPVSAFKPLANYDHLQWQRPPSLITPSVADPAWVTHSVVYPIPIYPPTVPPTFRIRFHPPPGASAPAKWKTENVSSVNQPAEGTPPPQSAGPAPVQPGGTLVNFFRAISDTEAVLGGKDVKTPTPSIRLDSRRRRQFLESVQPPKYNDFPDIKLKNRNSTTENDTNYNYTEIGSKASTYATALDHISRLGELLTFSKHQLPYFNYNFGNAAPKNTTYSDETMATSILYGLWRHLTDWNPFKTEKETRRNKFMRLKREKNIIRAANRKIISDAYSKMRQDLAEYHRQLELIIPAMPGNFGPAAEKYRLDLNIRIGHEIWRMNNPQPTKPFWDAPTVTPKPAYFTDNEDEDNDESDHNIHDYGHSAEASLLKFDKSTFSQLFEFDDVLTADYVDDLGRGPGAFKQGSGNIRTHP